MNRGDAVFGSPGLGGAPFIANEQQAPKVAEIALLFAGTFAQRPQFDGFYVGLNGRAESHLHRYQECYNKSCLLRG